MVWSNTRIGIGPILVKIWSLRSNAVINIQPSTGRPRLRNGKLWSVGGKKKALDQYLESADSLCCSICIEHDTDTSDVTIEQSHDLRGPWKWPTETHGRFWICSHSPTHSLTPSLSHPLPSFWLSDCCPLDLHLLLFYSSHQTFTVIRVMESLTQGFKDSRRFICHIHLSYSEVWSLCRSVDCSKNPASDLSL